MKSWLLLTLAVNTAAGTAPFRTFDDTPIPQGPVLYLTAENGLDEEKRRCGLLRGGLSLPTDLPITFIPAEVCASAPRRITSGLSSWFRDQADRHLCR